MQTAADGIWIWAKWMSTPVLGPWMWYGWFCKAPSLAKEHETSLCFFIFNFNYILCVWMLCLHVCLCILYVQCPQKPEEGIRSSRTGVIRLVWAAFECPEWDPGWVWRSSQCSYPPSHLSSLLSYFLHLYVNIWVLQHLNSTITSPCIFLKLALKAYNFLFHYIQAVWVDICYNICGIWLPPCW